MFCEVHRKQARMFAATFVKSGEITKPADIYRPDEDSQGDEPTPQSRGPDATATTTPSADATPSGADAPRPAEQAATTAQLDARIKMKHELNKQIHEALGEVRARSADPSARADKRWPQLSIYFVHERLHVRPYYTIIPRLLAGDAPDAATLPFALDDDTVTRALGEGGEVFLALWAEFENHYDRLRDRRLQNLDLQLSTYAGVIALNEHIPAMPMDRNLATFVQKTVAPSGKAFVRVAPNELGPVRRLLRHERW
jgi:hypothetical protein